MDYLLDRTPIVPSRWGLANVLVVQTLIVEREERVGVASMRIVARGAIARSRRVPVRPDL